MDNYLNSANGRYLLIATVAGLVDFAIAFVLLRAGLSPVASLAVSIAVAGLGQYCALEWWGFPGRRGGFSTERLAGSGLAEGGTYLVRLVVLGTWRRFFPGLDAADHFIGLSVAYLIAFGFGYFVRSRYVFGRRKGSGKE